MRKIWLLLVSLAAAIAARGQTAYGYRFWTDNDIGTQALGEAVGEKNFDLNISSLKSGLHALHMQARTADGGWSPVCTRYFFKAEQASPMTARYWFDNNPTTLHEGVATSGLIDLDISRLASGLHAVHYQMLGAQGDVSSVHTRYFFKTEQASPMTARYWFDNDPLTLHEGIATSGLIDLDISRLATGLHAVHYQMLGAQGDVSSVHTRYFFVDQLQISSLLALIGIDSEEPKEYALSEEDIIIDVSALSVGWHDLHVALAESNGRVLECKTLKINIPFPTATITISMAGEGTYCFDHDLDFSQSNDIRAYIASGYFPQTGHVLLTRALEVPAGTGIVVRGEQGTYKVPFGESSAYYLNLLVGNVERTTVQPTEGSYVNLLLTEGADGLGFYPVTSPVVLEANSARLQLPANLFSSGSNVKIAYEEDADGIIDVTGNADFTTDIRDVYDLQGRRQNAPQRGINIIRMNDGTTKKVLIK